MREAGAGSSIFSLERRKTGEGSEGRRRLSNGGGGSNVDACNGSRQRSSASGSSNGVVRTFEASVPATRDGDMSDSGEKRKASDDGLLLPQWGHGKRTRCSRFEPFKHAATAVEESASRLPSYKKPVPIVAKLRGHSEPRTCTKDGSLPRNGTLIRGSVRHGGGSADPPRLSPTKERISPQRRKASAADHRQQRQQEVNETPDNPASRMSCHGHGNGNGNGNTAHNHNNNGSCISSSDPSAAAAKLRFDAHTLEWPRIVIGLTRKDKEDDFLVIKGSKLPQRPKKRPKAVEKILHYCTPGNWLSDLSRGRYEVREKKCTKKKPTGLKAMESLESESE